MSEDAEYRRDFLLHVRRSVRRPTECWPWAGYVNPRLGYGFTGTEPAHRAVWKLLVGPITAGLELDHLCRNRECVNPYHLEPVSPYENNMRSESPAAVASRRTTCAAGHPYDVDNTGWRIDKRTGRPSRVCRTCKRLAMRAKR